MQIVVIMEKIISWESWAVQAIDLVRENIKVREIEIKNEDKLV